VQSEKKSSLSRNEDQIKKTFIAHDSAQMYENMGDKKVSNRSRLVFFLRKRFNMSAFMPPQREAIVKKSVLSGGIKINNLGA